MDAPFRKIFLKRIHVHYRQPQVSFWMPQCFVFKLEAQMQKNNKGGASWNTRRGNALL